MGDRSVPIDADESCFLPRPCAVVSRLSGAGLPNTFSELVYSPLSVELAIALRIDGAVGCFHGDSWHRLSFAAVLMMALPSDSARAFQSKRTAGPRENHVPVGKVSLYSREIGQGQPIIVLHGDPDFDHGYLLPDLDRLADSFRLIYYRAARPRVASLRVSALRSTKD